MKFGVDYLGGVKYQGAILQAQRPGDVGGIFLRTFGDARRTVTAMLKSGKFSEIVIHLAPFDGSHTYPISKLMPQIRKDARWAETKQKEYPATRLMLSPFCENKHTRRALTPVFNELRALAPSCLLVNSSMKGIALPGVITEIHLENSKPVRKPTGEYTVSFDGFGGMGGGDFPDADISTIVQRYPDARHVRAWHFRCNGKFGHLDKTPLERRNCWPGPEYLRGIREILEPRNGGVSWPLSKLYKSFSDDHGGDGNTKDNKAMCILPRESSSARVYDVLGNVIEVMHDLGLPPHTGEPRGSRFYSDLYAWQLGDLAEKSAGSRLIRIEDSPYTDANLRSNRFKG